MNSSIFSRLFTDFLEFHPTLHVETNINIKTFLDFLIAGWYYTFANQCVSTLEYLISVKKKTLGLFWPEMYHQTSYKELSSGIFFRNSVVDQFYWFYCDYVNSSVCFLVKHGYGWNWSNSLSRWPIHVGWGRSLCHSEFLWCHDEITSYQTEVSPFITVLRSLNANSLGDLPVRS